MTRLQLEDLTTEQRIVIDSREDLLVVGRPGTGKTSIALFKALAHLREAIDDDSKVLFLSFSRAAVQRIEAASRLEVPSALSPRLQITTFHAFCFEVITSHAKLVGMPMLASVIAPHEETMIKAEHSEPDVEFARLEAEEGRIRFERLLVLATDLFRRHSALRAAYARAYPLILVDEYQDTNDVQDGLVDLLGSVGQVIYLGDAEQRIYDWLKDVRHDRFERLIARRGVRRVDLPIASHRAGNSDLVTYARSVLSKTALANKPTDVVPLKYAPKHFPKQLRVAIVMAEKAVRKRAPGKSPEVAIMTYKNGFAERISRELFKTTDTFKHPFHHSLHVGLEDVGLAWRLALDLLGCSPEATDVAVAEVFAHLARFERARGGVGRTNRAMTLFDAANALRNRERIKTRTLRELAERVSTCVRDFTGEPARDIGVITAALRAVGGGFFDETLGIIDLRPPHESAALSSDLAERRSVHGFYKGARALGETLLLREHLVRGEAGHGGRVVMTLHKSKGKEFDAVVIADGPSDADALVLRDDDANLSRSRRLLAMAIARARFYVVIVTPAYRPCPLLPVIPK